MLTEQRFHGSPDQPSPAASPRDSRPPASHQLSQSGTRRQEAVDTMSSSEPGSESAADERIVYIVDDEQAVRDSLVALLQSVSIHAEAYESPASFLHSFVPDQAGCIVLDVRLPGMSGLELHEHLLQQGIQTPVIILTGYAEVGTAVQALKNGVVEFLEKVTSDQQLLDHVQQAMRDDARRRARRESARETRGYYERLPRRERQILAQVATGRTSQQIADHLQELKRKTVEAHRARIMRKMKAVNVADLVRKYLELRQTGAVNDPLEEPDSPDAGSHGAPPASEES